MVDCAKRKTDEVSICPICYVCPSSTNTRTRKEPIQLDGLYWIRRRPTLPGRFQPSTISVLRLNFCVRDGNRWIPQAIVTGNQTEFGFFAAAFLVPTVRPSSSRLPCTFSASAFLRTLKTAQARTSLPSDHDFHFVRSKLLPTSFFHKPLASVSVSAVSVSFRLYAHLSVRSALPYSLLPTP